MIVEPSPDGCRSYKLYEKIWHDAMQSIDRFEIYRPLSYWEALITRCGFKVALSKKFLKIQRYLLYYWKVLSGKQLKIGKSYL